MNKQTLCWALTGAGDVCEKKGGPPLYELPGHDLKTVHCRTREKGEDFARRHGPSAFAETLEEILKDPEVDAVYVATPPQAHHEQVVAAARAGKHILVEKPMAMTTAECEEMVHACEEAGVMLGVAYYRRCYPSIQRAKALLSEGGIGTLTHIFINNRFPPSHRLDLMHLLGGDLQEVCLKKLREEVGGVVQDYIQLQGSFVNGATLSMDLCKTRKGSAEQITLTGTEGEIFIDDLKGGSLVWNEKRETFAPLKWTHWGLVENFGHAVSGSADLACSGKEGLKSTAVLDWISTLKVDGDPAVIDYERPPTPDPAQMKQFYLLE